MITLQIFTRTIQIRCTDYATGFLIDSEDSRHLVTAAHVVRQYPTKGIDIRRNREWKPLTSCLEQTHIDTQLDIAVFRVQGEPSFERTAPMHGSEGVILGQDIYLCGFPTVDDQQHPDNIFPLPHVRKGILSAKDNRDNVWLVDALIESGYSGGPAVFVNGVGREQVLGIVKSIKLTSDLYNVEDAEMREVDGLFYRRQSGIIEVVDLAYLRSSGIL